VAKSYSVADARAHLPEILDEVEAGKDVPLTRRGQAVAVVVSRQRYEALQNRRAGFKGLYRTFRERHAVAEVGTETGYFDSLRDGAPGRKVRV
jgi:prevent-host-death family protein